MRVLLGVMALMLILQGGVLAGSTTISGGQGLTKFNSQMNNGIGIGVVQSGTDSVGVLTWHPDLKYGYFGLGLDVNLPLGDQRPANFDSVVVRYAEFDTGKVGVRYGILDNVTMGYGLLMDNYSTRTLGGAVLNNRQAGVKAYLNGELIGWDPMGFEVMGTWSNIYALRLTEKVHERLILGQTVVTDSDGVKVKQTDGSEISYPQRTGYAVDAGVPLWPGAKLYAEYARLVDYGGGANAGFGMGYRLSSFGGFSFKAERRMLDANFVPGYFNYQYETNPVDLASLSATAKNGYLAELKMDADLVLYKTAVRAVYEDYDDSNATLLGEVSLLITTPYEVELTAGFYQPNFVDFRSLELDQGAILTSSIGYKVNPYTKLISRYKKYYDTSQGKVVESVVYEAQIVF